MKQEEQQLLLLSTLIQLEQSARHAETIAELGFVMVNETLRLVPYRQAVFWTISHNEKINIKSVSGTDSPASDAPFAIDLTAIVKNLLHSEKTESGRKITPLSRDTQTGINRQHWEKWSLQQVLWCPLIAPDQNLIGGLFLVRDSPWKEGELILAERLLDGYAHAFWALRKHTRPAAQKILTICRAKFTRFLLTAAIIAALFTPVRLSVLAPMEIVPLDPVIVTSPMDGVIKTIRVNPNQTVMQGDPLLSLEDTGIRNKYEVSAKALEVVQAEYMRAIQKSFLDKDSRAQILMLQAEVELKKAEVRYADEILQLSKITAEKNGIAVYSNQEDWLGKPVSVGQKIMTIADPKKVEAEIMLPVTDALNLVPGAEVKLFLNTEPDHPLAATLKRADYEAHVTPVGELAFRLRASVTGEKAPRIGLRGTAKIYGNKVTLFYYLLRRPLTAVRIAIGI